MLCVISLSQKINGLECQPCGHGFLGTFIFDYVCAFIVVFLLLFTFAFSSYALHVSPNSVHSNPVSNDHVHLKAEHIPTLQVAFETVVCKTGFGTFPYVPPLLQCPYYYFVGKKTAKECPI